MAVMPFHQRLAELWLSKKGNLSAAEMEEISMCLTANAKWVWKMAYLENMSLMASMTNDVDWQHEICLEIDQLQWDPNAKKKPGRKGTD